MFNPAGIGILGAQQRDPYQQRRLFQQLQQIPAASPQFGVPGQVMPQQPQMRPASFMPVAPMAPIAAAVSRPEARPTMINQQQPVVVPGQQPQAGPGQAATAQLKAVGQRGQGLFGIDPQTWFDIAGGFASGAQNDDWGAALSGIGGALNNRAQRQDAQSDRKWRDEERGLARTEARRDDVRFTREEEEAALVRQMRQQATADWQAAIADPATPADRLAALRAAGPHGYADFVVQQYQMDREAEIQAQQSQTSFNRQADLTREGWRFEVAARKAEADAAAPLRSPYYRPMNSRDGMIYEEYESAARTAPQLLTSLYRARDLITNLAENNALGEPLDAAMRIQISRLTGDDPELAAQMEQLNSEIWPIIVANVQQLAPVGVIELQQATRAAPNANMQPQAAIATINGLIQATERTRNVALAGMDWAANNGSYQTGRNASGDTWSTGQQSALARTVRDPNVPQLGAVLGQMDLRRMTDGRDPRTFRNGEILDFGGQRYRIQHYRGGGVQGHRVQD